MGISTGLKEGSEYTTNTPYNNINIDNSSLDSKVKADVNNTSREDLSKEPTNLFPKASLSQIGIGVEEAKILAKEVLGVNKIELPETKQLIIEFQTKNSLLPADGQVGKNTYRKMFEISENSIALVEKAEQGFDQYGLDNDTLREISSLLPHMMMQSKEYQSLMYLVGRFKTCDKFDKDADARFLLRNIEGTSNKDQKVLEKSEKAQSFYATIKDPNLSAKEKFEKIIKDPTLLMVGGLLFLFGVIGGDSQYTNSFFKRIGWVMGIGLFGKAAWNKFGFGEMIDDAEGLGGSVYETIKEEAKIAKPKVTQFIKKDLQDMGENVTNFDFSKVKDKIGNQFDEVTTGISSYNDTFKGEGKPNKEGYIKPDQLGALVGILSEENVLNLSKGDVLQISSKNDLNGYISVEAQNKLKNAGVTNTDIKNFFSNHLIHEFGNDNNKKQVKDLFFTESIQNLFDSKAKQAKEQIALTKKAYVEDNVLNNDITKKVGGLQNSTNEKNRELGEKLEIAFKTGNIKKEDFKEYKDIISLITRFKEYKEFEKDYKSKKTKLENIKNRNDNVQKENIQEYLNEINKLTLESQSSFKNKFEEDKTKKIEEILQVAREKGMGDVNLVMSDGNKKTANKYFEDIRKEVEKNKKEELEKKLKEFNEEVKYISDELKKVNGRMKFSEAKEKLDTLEKRFNKISPSFTFDKVSNLAKGFANTITNFVGLDQHFDIKAEDPEEKEKNIKLRELAIDISNKHIDIESAFNTDLKKLETGKTIEECAGDRFKLLDTFTKDIIKKRKKKELIKSFEENYNKDYISSFQNLNEKDLIKLKTQYDILTKDLDDDLVGDRVEKAFEERKFYIKKDNIEKKTFNEISEDEKLKKIIKPIDDFLTKYENTQVDEEVLNLIQNNTVLKVIINKLILYSEMNDALLNATLNIGNNKVEDFKKDLKDTLNDYKDSIR